jgi:hypothetical protein
MANWTFFTYLVLAFILMLGCRQEGNQNTTDTALASLQDNLPGTWEAVSVYVTINSTDNQVDSTTTFEIKESEWITRMGVKPVKTAYQPDNKYRQSFSAVNDSLLSENKGLWNVFGDTLVMIEPSATYQYEVGIANGLATFKALLDWDGDGEEDDEYVGVHRKISAEY